MSQNDREHDPHAPQDSAAHPPERSTTDSTPRTSPTAADDPPHESRAPSLTLTEIDFPSHAQLCLMADERLIVRLPGRHSRRRRNRHSPKLKHHACVLLHVADADDAVQETWISVYESSVKSRFDENRGKFRTWLHCILHRKALRIIARNRHLLGLDVLDKPLVSYEEIADHDLFHDFAELASESVLTDEQGAVIDGLLAGKSIAQIAAEERRTTSAIRRRLARSIRKMLRKPA